MQAGSNVWLLTGRDVLMPAVFIGPSYRNGNEFYEVQSPQGRVYSANPANVYGYHEGRAMLKQRRAEELVAQSYEVRLMSRGAYRVLCPKKHGATGGYIVRVTWDGHCSCECPDFAKSVGECRRTQSGNERRICSPAGEGEAACKHVLGLPGLLRAKASEAAIAGKAGHAQTYLELAEKPEGVHKLSRAMTLPERLAAVGISVDHDFA